MRFPVVPECILCSVHLSSIGCCPQFVCCTVFASAGRSTPSSDLDNAGLTIRLDLDFFVRTQESMHHLHAVLNCLGTHFCRGHVAIIFATTGLSRRKRVASCLPRKERWKVSWRPSDPKQVIPHPLHGPPQQVGEIMTKQMSVQSVLVSLLCVQGGKHKVGGGPTRRESTSTRQVARTSSQNAEPSIPLLLEGRTLAVPRGEGHLDVCDDGSTCRAAPRPKWDSGGSLQRPRLVEQPAPRERTQIPVATQFL